MRCTWPMSTRGSIAIAQECHERDAGRVREPQRPPCSTASAPRSPCRSASSRHGGVASSATARHPCSCLRAISVRCASASVSSPEQTLSLSSFSIWSTSAARGYGSGQRFRGSVGWPPSSRLIEVVLLVVRGRAGQAVRRHLLDLELRRVARRRPDRARPAADADRAADRGLGDVGVERRRASGSGSASTRRRAAALRRSASAPPAGAPRRRARPRDRGARAALDPRYERRAHGKTACAFWHTIGTLPSRLRVADVRRATPRALGLAQGSTREPASAQITHASHGTPITSVCRPSASTDDERRGDERRARGSATGAPATTRRRRARRAARCRRRAPCRSTRRP